MLDVAEIYQRIIHHQQQQTEEQAREEFELRTLDLSFGRVQSDRQIIQRLATDNATLHALALRTNLDFHTRRNLFRFLSSAFTSAERYVSVTSASDLVEKSLELFRSSEFLTDILVRHPDAIRAIADLRQSSPRHQRDSLFPIDESTGSWQGHALQKYLASNTLTYGDKLALLRQHFRRRIFLSGARDVIEARPVFASLADNTFAAEEAISAAFAMSNSSGVAAMALGRLGTHEFDALSDVDLVFVRDPGISSEDALRSVESIMHSLSAYTQEGTVLTVDVQLRPHGSDGPLTTTPDQMGVYLAKEAHAWEGLAYSKLRFIAGDEQVASDALGIKSEIFNRFSQAPGFKPGLLEMRCKLENSDNEQNFKTGPGGLYDIDFISGYLLICHGMTTAEGNARQRIQRLGQAGLLGGEHLQTLLDALDLYRTIEHVARLVTGRVQRSLPVSENARRNVEDLVGRIYSFEIAKGLDDYVATTRTAVRNVFDRVFQS
jgi:glutamate-ammonia-ligase adenylyltransferase